MKIKTIVALILLGIIFLYMAIVLYLAEKQGDLYTNPTFVYEDNIPEMPDYTINFTIPKK
jgi:hypothetical protein